MSRLPFRWPKSTPPPPPPPPPPSLPHSPDSTPPPHIPPPPRVPTEWEYDLFVSYRGEDVKKKFRSHLFDALEERDVDFFRDDDPEGRGEKLDNKIFGAIPRSRVVIMLLSPRYADSRWCLDELVEILKHKKDHTIHGKGTILPVFFGVSAGDVKKQEHDFGAGFEQLKQKHTVDKVNNWKNALDDVPTSGGLSLNTDCNGDERILIDKILQWLNTRGIPDSYCILGRDVIGRDRDADDVISLYSSIGQQKNACVVGIYGIQDVGKTRLVNLVVSRMYQDFNYVCLVENVRNKTQEGVVEQLFGKVSTRHRPLIYELQGRIVYINRKLRQKKALLVFDDVDRKEKVDKFLQDRQSFCAGSLILITSRDERLLNELEVDDRYMVSALGSEGSLKLFCHHTFKEDKPREGYKELSTNLCHYAGGLPRAVEKLGSHFRYSKSSREDWEKALEKLVGNPRVDIIGSKPFKVGPFPNSMSSSFDDKAYTGVRQIEIITVNSSIESIIIDYDQNGCLIRSARYGGTRQGKSYTIKLDYPREYLTSVSGLIREDCKPEAMQSLHFKSNLEEYSLGVVGRGREFKLPKVDYAKIIGFHGHSGAALHSIGAYFGSTSDQFPFKKVGPFGGQAGEPWDDGNDMGIRQMDVFVLNSVVEAISIWYDDDHGRPGGELKHGENARGQRHSVKLDYPREYLISISGYVTKDCNDTRISSISLQTNRQEYGPFGEETGQKFSFPTKCGKITGFYGTIREQRLESIGAHYQLVSHIYPMKKFGPFGGESGVPWDDGKHADIKQITIRYGSVVNSIACVYDKPDKVTMHGGSGDQYKLILLDSPDEYITSMCGYIAEETQSVVSSITFVSNRRIWGPFGIEEGRYFSLPLNSGKIIGFHGRTDGYCLNSIGAHFDIYSSIQYPFKSVGLFGGEGIKNWDDGRFTNVKRIEIVVDSVVKSIKFEYETDHEGPLSSCSHGLNVRGRTNTITLDRDEYLTSLSGYYNDTGGCIGSLIFQSNKRTCGPYGFMTGKYFSAPATGGKIVGFYGRNNYSGLISIGAHFEPISLLYPAKRIGPFGGQGGNFWCDENSSTVTHVNVLSDKAGIVRVYARYKKNGKLFWSSGYAPDENSRWKVDTVTLDHPSEYLTSISGYIMDSSDPIIIRSLIFQSNKRSYGPYGKKKPKGTYFWYPSTGGKIVSFYGYCTSSHLSSIGVYTEPISHQYPFRSVGPYGGQEGTRWGDGIFTDVRRIDIQYGSVIVAFSVEYDNDGSPIRCPEHGNDRTHMVCGRGAGAEEGGETRPAKRARTSTGEAIKSVTIKLDFPKEHIVSITGYTGRKYCEEVIWALTVKTNLRTCPTYGTPKGKPFQLPEEENCGRIIGFHGTSGRFLNSLGARLEPF